MKRGFSLTELLTVIAIIGILSATTIVGYRDYQKRVALQTATDQISSMINRALDLSYAKPADQNIDGFGVQVYSDKVILYANKDNSGGLASANMSYNDKKDELIKKYDLKSNVTISPPLWLYFTLPLSNGLNPYDKKIYTNDPNNPNGTPQTSIGDRTITLSSEGNTKIISINTQTGLVTIK